MTAYYNEIDPYAAQWLRNLVSARLIAPGDVDERSILEVEPNDLVGYAQCHFFAGIGLWSAALRSAGWPDDRPVWTGSCPCQGFSVAGQRKGFDDERHLWPAWHYLIEQRRPPIIFGEQVASPDGYAWLDLVQADLEGTSYACGPVVSPAAGYGAPHGRHRIYFVADADSEPRGLSEHAGWSASFEITGRGQVGELADDDDARLEGRGGMPERPGQCAVGAHGLVGELEQSCFVGRQRRQEAAHRHDDGGQASERSEDQHGLSVASAHRFQQYTTGPTNDIWRDADWLLCKDNKWRPVEPGTFPLAHGYPQRVGRLRAYGNAIVVPQAAAFVRAYLDS